MRGRVTKIIAIGYTLAMLILSLATLSDANGQVKQQSGAQVQTLQTLPEFTYYTMDGAKYTNHNLNANSNVMIVYYNPLCELCREETKEILNNIDYFKNIQIVMISPNTKEEIMSFINELNLNKYTQITLLHDPDDVFYKQFQATGYPTLYLYNEKRVLIGHFNEQTEINSIKEVFNNTVAKNSNY